MGERVARREAQEYISIGQSEVAIEQHDTFAGRRMAVAS